METTALVMINAEAPALVADELAVSTTEFVVIDDVQMRQVGGGLVVEVVY
jgi:hypothetical protein